MHLLLLYPKHVIKLSGYNLGCYTIHVIQSKKIRPYLTASAKLRFTSMSVMWANLMPYDMIVVI